MEKLNNKRLKEILKKINTDPQKREQYTSKLSHILKFLNNNTGLKNAGIKPGGSRAKQTDIRKSDLDIIFCTSTDQNHATIRNHILEKVKQSFGKIAKIELGKKAVQIDFNSPQCNIDLVYLTKEKFQEQSKKINKIKKMRPLHKNAIKLAKYAIDRAGLKNIKSYEVEMACLNSNYNNLVDCTYHLIKHFTGRIKQKGLKIDDVLKYLN